MCYLVAAAATGQLVGMRPHQPLHQHRSLFQMVKIILIFFFLSFFLSLTPVYPHPENKIVF